MKELEDGTPWVTVLDSWVSQDAALHGLEAGKGEGAEAALLNEQPNSQFSLSPPPHRPGSYFHKLS